MLIAILGVLIAIVLLPVIAYALRAIAYALLLGLIGISRNGGILGTIRELMPPPDLSSQRLTKKRSRCRSAIESIFNQLQNDMQLHCYGTSTHDCCEKGDHGPKVKNDWAYRCTFLETRFYAFNGDFRNRMLELDAALGASGFTEAFIPDDFSEFRFTLNPITDYYDGQLAREKQKREQGGDSGKYLGNSLVSDLLLSEFTNKDLHMQLQFAERDTQDLHRLKRIQKLTWASNIVSQKREALDTNAIFEKMISKNQYVMAVSIQAKYFENGQLLPKKLLNLGRRRHRKQCCVYSN